MDHTLKNLSLHFVQLQDEKSNIGFYISSRLVDSETTNGENKFKVIQGVLSATGEILKIEGANADTLVGKNWDDLSKLIVK